MKSATTFGSERTRENKARNRMMPTGPRFSLRSYRFDDGKTGREGPADTQGLDDPFHCERANDFHVRICPRCIERTGPQGLRGDGTRLGRGHGWEHVLRVHLVLIEGVGGARQGVVTELGIDILQLRAVQEWVMGHRNGRQRWLMVAVPVTPLRSITEGGLPLRGLGRTFGLESARWGGLSLARGFDRRNR